MKEQYRMSAAANTEIPAFKVLEEMNFVLKKIDSGYSASKDRILLKAESGLELLGLAKLYSEKGENWRVEDVDIDYYLDKLNET